MVSTFALESAGYVVVGWRDVTFAARGGRRRHQSRQTGWQRNRSVRRVASWRERDVGDNVSIASSREVVEDSKRA